MNLREYIEEIGDRRAARLFGVAQRTAASWRQGVRRPMPEQAREIVRITHGLVTYEGIYGDPFEKEPAA